VALIDLAVGLFHRGLHRQRRAHGALRVVLVRHRGAEDAHHVVADELVDRAAEALDLPPSRRRVRSTSRDGPVHPLGRGG
jgi:hypothetical protein